MCRRAKEEAYLRGDPDVEHSALGEELLGEITERILISIGISKGKSVRLVTTTSELDDDGLALKRVGDSLVLVVQELGSLLLDLLDEFLEEVNPNY